MKTGWQIYVPGGSEEIDLVSSVKPKGVMVAYYDDRNASTSIYDEAGLRRTMAGFLSNESRARYGDDKFMQYDDFYKSLEWFMEGLKLFKTKA